MRGWRLAALLLALGAALAATGLYTVPRALDWDRHRATLAAIASERLGRAVAVTGPVSVVLLPQPRMEAQGLLIGWEEDEIRMTARGIRLRLALPALLTGRIEVREMALLGAVIHLPWPLTPVPGIFEPAWPAGFDARIEDSRVVLGGAVVEGVTARLHAAPGQQALTAEGSLAWRGRPMRFQAVLRRASDDGAAALDFQGEAEGATLRARGALLTEGGFEGRLEAEGPRLAALLPAPPGAFRATAELEADAQRLAARNMFLQFGEQRVRGAATLTLGAASEFRVALAAPSLEVQPWLDALRGTAAPALPVVLDLAAEQSRLGPLPLRRLRASARLEGERLTLSDVSAELPGGTEVRASGAGRGEQLDLTLGFRSGQPAELAAAVGWPAALHPGPGSAEGQFRLLIEGPQFSVNDLRAGWGSATVAGGFVWRGGARPRLALGLDFDAVEPGPALPEVLAALRAAGRGNDLQLRLGFGRLMLGDAVFERLSLDGAAEGGRMLVRRLTARHLGLDLTLTGALDDARLAEMSLEAEGVAGPALALVGLDRPALAGLPLRLRASGAGPFDAIALRADAELAEARLQWQGTLDTAARAAQGAVTLHHPGAARLLGRLAAGEGLDWLGDGSFSLVAAMTHRPGQWGLDNLELVAGGARGRGQLGLALAAGGRPALSGRLAFERLPLPPLERWRPDAAAAFDLALELAADQLAVPGLPPLTAAAGLLRGDANELRLAEGRASLLAGEAQLEARMEPRDGTGRLRLDGGFEGLALGGPVFGRPLDLTAGHVSGSFRLTGQGVEPASVLRSLAGSAEITVRDGVVGGFDAPVAAAALGWEDVPAAEAALRRALSDGATPVERGLLRMRLDRGTAWITDGELRGEAGLQLGLAGHFGLAEDGLALRLELPVPPGAPRAGLDISGPSRAPDRRPDIIPFLRWRAEAPR